VTFEELVAVRGTAWLRLAYLLTGDRHLAEDLLQTALVQVYRTWRVVERVEQPDAYVRRVLVNTLIDWRRRRSWWERPTASGTLPADLAGARAPLGGPLRDVPDGSEELAARDVLWQLLRRLTPKARAVLVLRFYEDLDDPTIGTLLGLATSSVRSTASRALAQLRVELATSDAGVRGE
jgi:RNA polymerase sigma factor (sigma-70 family)